MTFSNIPDDVLNIELETIDEQFLTLQEILQELTDEDIETAKYIVTDDDGIPALESFLAWTKSSIIVYYKTVSGCLFEIYERNPT